MRPAGTWTRVCAPQPHLDPKQMTSSGNYMVSCLHLFMKGRAACFIPVPSEQALQPTHPPPDPIKLGPTITNRSSPMKNLSLLASFPSSLHQWLRFHAFALATTYAHSATSVIDYFSGKQSAESDIHNWTVVTGDLAVITIILCPPPSPPPADGNLTHLESGGVM